MQRLGAEPVGLSEVSEQVFLALVPELRVVFVLVALRVLVVPYFPLFITYMLILTRYNLGETDYHQ